MNQLIKSVEVSGLKVELFQDSNSLYRVVKSFKSGVVNTIESPDLDLAMFFFEIQFEQAAH